MGLSCCACRLPKFDSVVLKTQYVLNNVGLVLLLRAMGQQLTQLRSLTIDAVVCTGWRRARAAWEQLASIRQLTSLNLDLGLEPVNLADLGLLGQLTALEELVLVAPRAWWPYGRYNAEPEPVQQQQQQDEEQGSDSESEQGSDSSEEEQEHDLENPAPEQQQQQGPEQAEVQVQQRDRVGLYFLQRLQALKSLRLVMPTFTGFESGVSSCTQLKCLHLGAGLFPGANPGRQPGVSTAQCEVLSALPHRAAVWGRQGGRHVCVLWRHQRLASFGDPGAWIWYQVDVGRPPRAGWPATVVYCDRSLAQD